ncbi:phage tail protein [uncultured Hoeflea sp.]|uniref:phage tail protein n=1 Tax=uncultured Hoeflea sp. TaxID=538666 RepID=UPI0030D86663
MTSLLPSNAGHFETAVEAAHAERWTRMGGAVPFITTAKENPPPSFLPFLVWEFGLGMLTPYVDNLYEVIDEGVRWHRVRGTYGGVKQGLGFVGVTATLEPAWHGRAWWNSNQLRMSALPANDAPLLERIEGITRLSLPFRSDLRRGVYEYDIDALQGDHNRLDDCHLDVESGVRLYDGGTVWSFGRTAEIDHTLTEAEGIAIGNWLDVPEEGGIPWASMTYPWVTATFGWADNPETQRRELMAAWFPSRAIYLMLKDSDEAVIGYRRARAVHAVSAQFGGQYSIDGQTYAPSENGTRVYIEAMTDFEDADDVETASVSVVTALTRADGIPVGRLWLRPQDVTAATAFAETEITLPLRKTVRERIKFLVRF